MNIDLDERGRRKAMGTAAGAAAVAATAALSAFDVTNPAVRAVALYLPIAACVGMLSSGQAGASPSTQATVSRHASDALRPLLTRQPLLQGFVVLVRAAPGM